MPHFACPQSNYEEGEHFHISVSIFFSQLVIMLIQEAQTHFAKATPRVSEDKGLQWLLLQAGSLSARELESHSQSHLTVV